MDEEDNSSFIFKNKLKIGKHSFYPLISLKISLIPFDFYLIETKKNTNNTHNL